MDGVALQEAVDLLKKEFPELSRATIEGALRECDGDISATRRKLYALPSSTSGGEGEGVKRTEDSQLAQQLQRHYDAGGSDRPASDPLSSWLNSTGSGTNASGAGQDDSWNMGLEEVATSLSNFGAQLSLGFRQVTYSIGQWLPPEINPFLEMVDEDEEYEPDAASLAAAAAERERAEVASASARGGSAEVLHKRGGRSAAPLARQPTAPEDEDEEGWEEEDSKWE